MKKKKVIASKNLPSRLPAIATLSTWIALDYWHAPQWLWGALGLFYLILWAGVIYTKYMEEQTDIFESD